MKLILSAIPLLFLIAISIYRTCAEESQFYGKRSQVQNKEVFCVFLMEILTKDLRDSNAVPHEEDLIIFLVKTRERRQRLTERDTDLMFDGSGEPGKKNFKNLS
jgi:hypothetical protein